MTFRSEEALKSSTLTIADLKEGQVVDGTVNRIEPYGLLIQIQRSKLKGLCRKTELTDNKDADVDAALEGFRAGDKVKACILKLADRRIALSLKPSRLGDAGFVEDEEAEDDDEEEYSDGFWQEAGQLPEVEVSMWSLVTGIAHATLTEQHRAR